MRGTSRGGGGRSASAGGAGNCYSCGLPGHQSRDCPSGRGGGGGSRGGAARGGGGGGGGGGGRGRRDFRGGGVSTGDVDEDFRIAVDRALTEFRAGDEHDEISFPATLTAVERKHVHFMCAQLGLQSKSHGKGDARTLTVRPKTPTPLKFEFK